MDPRLTSLRQIVGMMGIERCGHRGVVGQSGMLRHRQARILPRQTARSPCRHGRTTWPSGSRLVRCSSMNSSTTPTSSRRFRVAVIATAAFSLIASACGGGDDSTANADVLEFRPVEVVGDPLPSFEGETTSDTGIGSIAPVLSGASFDGTPVTIDHGQYTMVVFLAHWCPHCQAEVPRLVSWAESLSVPANLKVYGVTTATGDDRPNYPPSRWLTLERFPFVTMADDQRDGGTGLWHHWLPICGDARSVGRRVVASQR